ncbi:MAG: PqqD family protein [Candidatus Acidiferrales bacterium]
MSERFIARGPALAYRVLGGETIVMSAGDTTLFSLDELGSFIWRMADGRTPLSSIVAGICDQYDVPPETASRDAEEFVAGLANRGLLVISDHAIAEADRVPGANS